MVVLELPPFCFTLTKNMSAMSVHHQYISVAICSPWEEDKKRRSTVTQREGFSKAQYVVCL